MNTFSLSYHSKLHRIFYLDTYEGTFTALRISWSHHQRYIHPP